MTTKTEITLNRNIVSRKFPKSLADIAMRARKNKHLNEFLSRKPIGEHEDIREYRAFISFSNALWERYWFLQQNYDVIRLDLSYFPEDYAHMGAKLKRIAERKFSNYTDVEARARERLKIKEYRESWDRWVKLCGNLPDEVRLIEQDSREAGFPIRIFINFDIISHTLAFRMEARGEGHLIKTHGPIEQSEHKEMEGV